MAKDNNRSGEPKVIGSTHFVKVNDHFESVNNKNDISTILFERQKNKFKEKLIADYADIYERAFNTIEEWMKDIETLKKPDKVIEQRIKGTDEFAEVEQFEKGKKEKLNNLIAKYVKLCELFDAVNADEGSTTENYNALDKHLKNNKK
jgi:hypothetical protein